MDKAMEDLIHNINLGSSVEGGYLILFTPKSDECAAEWWHTNDIETDFYKNLFKEIPNEIEKIIKL